MDFENGGFRVLPQCSSKREKKARESSLLRWPLSQCRKNFLRAAKPPFREGTRAEAVLPATPIAAVFPRFHANGRSRQTERVSGTDVTSLASLSPLSLRPTEQSPFPSLAPRFRSLVSANGPMAEKTAAVIGMRNARLENEPRRSSPMAEDHRWFCSPITSECFVKRVCKIYRLILTLLLQ
ncbi:hypothetical protein K0M31_015080 [Melipona bicolor]|uniref:Uncharacterized protein n=1 Tax=Melipona bicolor TaxID=60889 RepID=A0AA40FGE5_9HYME|nr:hypothetical protein K0M31_015080 [Melipona bicolor]